MALLMGIFIWTRNWGMAAIAMLIWIPSLGASVFSSKGMSARTVMELMLDRALCPACGEDLIDVPKNEEDNLIPCPSCGAAWRNDRIEIRRWQERKKREGLASSSCNPPST